MTYVPPQGEHAFHKLTTIHKKKIINRLQFLGNSYITYVKDYFSIGGSKRKILCFLRFHNKILMLYEIMSYLLGNINNKTAIFTGFPPPHSPTYEHIMFREGLARAAKGSAERSAKEP